MRRSNLGFTLIEILVVMAIGGIIMVMIIKGVNSLQVARRDRIRRQAVTTLVDAIERNAANHGNVYPVCWFTPAPCPIPEWTPPKGINFVGPTWDDGLYGWHNLNTIDWTSGSYLVCPGTTQGGHVGQVGTQLEGGGYFCENY